MARGIGRRLTFKEEKILDELIQKNSVISKGSQAKDRIVRYADGWNDERILGELNSRSNVTFSLASITRFRNTQLGFLPKGGGPVPGLHSAPSRSQPVLTQLAFLKRDVSKILDRVARMERFLAEQGYMPSEEEDPKHTAQHASAQ